MKNEYIAYHGVYEDVHKLLSSLDGGGDDCM